MSHVCDPAAAAGNAGPRTVARCLRAVQAVLDRPGVVDPVAAVDQVVAELGECPACLRSAVGYMVGFTAMTLSKEPIITSLDAQLAAALDLIDREGDPDDS